jgi:hypothetical protein
VLGRAVKAVHDANNARVIGPHDLASPVRIGRGVEAETFADVCGYPRRIVPLVKEVSASAGDSHA